MKMQLFRNDVIFSSSRVLVSDNCKQSITVWFFTINVFTDIVLKLGRAYQWENCLTATNDACRDAVAGLPVPLSGLHRTVEPVWSTRLQTFLTVLNFHHLSGYNWKLWLSHQVLAHETSAFNAQNLTRWKRWVLVEKLTPFDEMLR